MIDTETNTVDDTISVGAIPYGIAITRDGKAAYVADFGSGDSVTPIDLATNTAGTAIPVGPGPNGIAITPDGKTAYVSRPNFDVVTPISLANTAGTDISVGAGPYGVAVAPNGRTAYAVDYYDNNVTPIDTVTNAAGTRIGVGANPLGIAIVPDQAPVADFSAGISESNGTIEGTFVSDSQDPDCATAFVFTGQTASCDGSRAARLSRNLHIP